VLAPLRSKVQPQILAAVSSISCGALALAGAALLLLWRWTAARHPGRYLLACLVALASLFGAAAWRIESADYAYPLSAAAQREVQAVFLPRIPVKAVVYWENDVRGSWFLLQRSSYVSSVQLAGAAFNRGTALEGARRLGRLQRLGVQDSIREHDELTAKLRMAALPPPSLEGLAYVCSDPLLDFVVLTWRLGDGGIARIKDRENHRSWYLYDCALLRAAPPQVKQKEQ
jgi:hypothetical protein